MDNYLIEALERAMVLGQFKRFCEENNNNESIIRLRRIFNSSSNIEDTIMNLFKKQGIEFDSKNSSQMASLVFAFLNKSKYRRKIDIEKKELLLYQQNYKCAICGAEIDIHAHADHIVPFKYVGDELDDNLQMLCERCNKEKNASIDYQIKYFLQLTRR